jgi:hypothetical protein
MRLPEVRARLVELADEHGIDELRDLAEATRRRRHGRAAPVVSATVTPDLANAVRAYCAAFPEMPMHEVSKVFQLNQGRVSEIRHGKRA